MFDSVAVAEACQATVPLPDASKVQMKSLLPPEWRTRPAADAGWVATATAALPVVSAVGEGNAASVTSAPPEFVAVRVSEARCRPAETRAGVAATVSTSLPGVCACTEALVTVPVEGFIVASFPSVACALETNTTWPADVADVLQVNDALWPACSTATVPAATGVTAPIVAVAPEAVVGAAAETLTASAVPVFCTTSVSPSAWPTLTRVRSGVSVAVSFAGACAIMSPEEGETVAALVFDALAVRCTGPAAVTVAVKVKVADAPAARFCAASAGPVMVRLPSPTLPRCERDAIAPLTAVWPLLVTTTRRLSACPTDAVAGSPRRPAFRPPGCSTGNGGAEITSPMRCAEVLVSVPVTRTWMVSVPAPIGGTTSNVKEARAPPASRAARGDGGPCETAAPAWLVTSSVTRVSPEISAPPVLETSTVSVALNPSTSCGARTWMASAPAVCT